jgi:hypothetical protein
MQLAYARSGLSALPLSPRFVTEALDRLAAGTLLSQTSGKDRQDGVGGMNAINYVPLPDSPEAKLSQIRTLLNKGDTVKALDRAAELLKKGNLDPEMTEKLSNLVKSGILDLSTKAQHVLAHDYTMLFQPLLNPYALPAPAINRPSFALSM